MKDIVNLPSVVPGVERTLEDDLKDRIRVFWRNTDRFFLGSVVIMIFTYSDQNCTVCGVCGISLHGIDYDGRGQCRNGEELGHAFLADNLVLIVLLIVVELLVH